MTIAWIILWGVAAIWAFRRPRRRKIWGSIFICIALFGGIGGLAAQQPSQPAVKTKTIQVGTDRLAKAKAESRQLALLASTQTASSEKLDDQSSSLAAQASAKVSAQKAASRSASKQAQAAAKASQETATSSATRHHSRHTRSSQGDVTTGQRGQIIGNKNSKIYHVPGQAGYHMNSRNAVYFQTTAQAEAAGYRKALR